MIKNLICDYLIKEKLINIDNSHAENFIEIYNEREVVISGNRLGLIELADYIVSVALSDVDKYHLHLDETNFFNSTNLELVILSQNEKQA